MSAIAIQKKHGITADPTNVPQGASSARIGTEDIVSRAS